jgi:phage-related protein (TIGR01555 family)
MSTEEQLQRFDGALINALSGMGTLGRDRSRYTKVRQADFLDLYTAQAMYMQWLPRRVVDLVADECTRAGIRLTMGGESGDAGRMQGLINDVMGAWEDYGADAAINETLKLSRLYGGALLLLDIDDGQADDQPVRVDRIRRIRGMYPMDRWRVYPIMVDQVMLDLSRPAMYGVSYSVATQNMAQDRPGGAGNQEVFRVHPSRVLRLDGDYLPWFLRQQNYGWGVSCLQRMVDSFKYYETGVAASASILDSFDLFVHKFKGLGALVAAGREGDLRTRLSANQMARSVYQGMVIDSDGEEVSFVSRSVGGVSDVLDRLRSEIQGATGIPHTILWGDSPSGMGATGRSEERDFAKTCHQYQEAHLRRPIHKLLTYFMAAKEGPTNGKAPDGWAFEFNDLYQPYPDEVAELRSKVAGTDVQYINAGVLSAEEVAQARFGGAEWSMDTTLERNDNAPNHADATAQLNLYQTLKSVNAGELPIDTGVQLVMRILGITQAEAKKIVGTAGEEVAKQQQQADAGGGAPGGGQDLAGQEQAAQAADAGSQQQDQQGDQGQDDQGQDDGLPSLDSAAIALVRHSGVTVAVTGVRNGVQLGHIVCSSGQRLDSDTGIAWVALSSSNGRQAYEVPLQGDRRGLLLGCYRADSAAKALRQLGVTPAGPLVRFDPLELTPWA